MKHFYFLLTLAMLLSACGLPQTKLSAGLDNQNFDFTVRPQDDFYQYVNGGWLKRTTIPADKSRYGAFTEIHDATQIQLRELMQRIATEPANDEQTKLANLLASFKNQTQIDALGLQPIAQELEAIALIKNHRQLIAFFGFAQKMGLPAPLGYWIDQDHKNTTQYQIYLTQAGLGLPDRDYYLEDRFAIKRAAYLDYLNQLSQLAGHAINADAVLALETRLARAQWTRVENRDRNATYNKTTLADLTEAHPNLHWPTFFTLSDLSERIDTAVVRQPSYFAKLNRIITQTPVDVWKDYLAIHTLSQYAPYLPKAYVDLQFGFYGTTLKGVEANRPRWKRGLSLLNSHMGEALGKAYVEQHFQPHAKHRMNELIDYLQQAFAQSIDQLDWMSADTKVRAQQKLNKFTAKIAYPDQWRDYTTLQIEPDQLIANLQRATQFHYQLEVQKLGGPINRQEWFMTPQTVNAYYNPSMNEIVFPAAILQPPFFNVLADDAVNYGGIGAVIGHEFSHGFDDQGRKSDGDGNLTDWWNEADAEQFAARAETMVKQFNAIEPLVGHAINGELTLGENIADLAGITMAYRAYQQSLAGKPSPIIDGFTGEQRFFMGWAQAWRALYRDEALKQQLITDPHSPPKYRVQGILPNLPEFFEAFDVQPEDGMFLPTTEQVVIW